MNERDFPTEHIQVKKEEALDIFNQMLDGRVDFHDFTFKSFTVKQIAEISPQKSIQRGALMTIQFYSKL